MNFTFERIVSSCRIDGDCYGHGHLIFSDTIRKGAEARQISINAVEKPLIHYNSPVCLRKFSKADSGIHNFSITEDCISTSLSVIDTLM